MLNVIVLYGLIGEFPIEKFLASYGKFRQNTNLLRRLMALLVPADDSSFLMEALRIKGKEVFLESFIPFGDPVRVTYITKAVAFGVKIDSKKMIEYYIFLFLEYPD